MEQSWGRNLAWLTAILGAIGLLLYLYVLDTWVVPEGDPALAAAIQPTLSPEDRILTRRGRTPRPGELARCMRPDVSGTYVIGRVFGLDRDSVQIENERVVVNGKLVATRHGCEKVDVIHPISGEMVSLDCTVESSNISTFSVLVHPQYREGTRSVVVVEPGKAYLVSDNRHIHLDSRDFGLVDVATCEQVVFRLWGQPFVDASHRFNILW